MFQSELRALFFQQLHATTSGLAFANLVKPVVQSQPKRKKVLLVCMVDSIHVARWVSQFDESEVEFVLFPSTPNRRVHDGLKDKKIVPFKGWLSIPLWGLDLLFSDRVRGWLLRRQIRKFKPDFVHALELQHGGYIAERAYSSKQDSPLIATNWGSDIYWFQRFKKHEIRLRSLLSKATLYSAECVRDLALARNLGFKGEMLPVIPNAGGFTDEQLALPRTKTSSRKTIAIKGYEGWVGRASVALNALPLVGENLKNFEIVVYSANAKTVRLARKVSEQIGQKIQVHKKKALSHTQVLEMFARSRAYVGISLSDGISTSLLEAMAMGAFPIQTGTACTNEWFKDGLGGLEVRELTPGHVAQKLSETLTNDLLIDAAAELNSVKIFGSARKTLIEPVARSFYGLAP